MLGCLQSVKERQELGCPCCKWTYSWEGGDATCVVEGARLPVREWGRGCRGCQGCPYNIIGGEGMTELDCWEGKWSQEGCVHGGREHTRLPTGQESRGGVVHTASSPQSLV